MLALGAVLAVGALLALAGLALIFRRPEPPRWTEHSLASELAAVGIVAVFAIGLGCLGAGAMTAWREGPDFLDLGLLVVVLAGALMLWRRLDVRARLNAMEAATTALGPVPGQMRVAGQDATLQAPVTMPEPPPSRPTRRAA
jgi:hypothetical protein